MSGSRRSDTGALVAGELRTLRRVVYRSLFGRHLYPPGERAAIVDRFHELYHDSHLVGGTWADTRWLGVPTAKCPFDLWTYQEILFETGPDLVVETGTAAGGSALYLASILDLLGAGRVVTVDIAERDDRPRHERITYLDGSSTDERIAARVGEEARGARRVMVILDSDHALAHVRRELELYAPLVTPGCYLVVEDTDVNGHPVAPEHGPGPWEAAAELLAGSDDFVVDESREKFLLTFNPRGFLRRVR